jgi:hypothetical protein
MDPLRPFADFVRSLSRRTTPARAAETAQGRAVSPEQLGADASALATEGLDAKLRAQLGRTGVADRVRAREAFVEVVLAFELGDQLCENPGFAELVKGVSSRIDAHPQLSERLHELLVDLARTGA